MSNGSWLFILLGILMIGISMLMSLNKRKVNLSLILVYASVTLILVGIITGAIGAIGG